VAAHDQEAGRKDSSCVPLSARGTQWGLAECIQIERLKLTPEGAFALLVQASQQSSTNCVTGLRPQAAAGRDGSTAGYTTAEPGRNDHPGSS
jgi:hypothetical protein